MGNEGAALRPARARFAVALACGIFCATAARANTDEIQVYDASIAAPGTFNLTLHGNYTPAGLEQPDFPGGLVSDGSYNGVAEWAYGVADWFEAGLYLPLYSVTPKHGAQVNGFKLRALFVVPDARQRTFFYGINFEFSYHARHWDTRRFTSEIRPIIGWHLGEVDVVFNPILDNSFTGARNLDFAPSARLAYAASPRWTVAAEEYADFGPLHNFYSPRQQSHQLFGVIDYTGAPISIEFGIGAGLTSASDQAVAKLILSKDIN